jgi:uncharacterized membrane protein YraQ (UPF0718 family)/copper chaperone CopZ
MDTFFGIFNATQNLFYDMAPYLMLGLFFVALFNLFFTKDMITKHVGKNNIWSVIKAAMLGVPLPLCSCGVIPTAVYISKNGASKGAVVSFLISTPQTGVDSMIATYGLLGPVFAIFRPIAAFIMGIFGGWVTTKIKTDEHDEQRIIAVDEYTIDPNLSFFKRVLKTFRYAYIEFLDDITEQFIFGLLIAGLITYFVPENFFSEFGITDGILGMLILAAIGIPMYVCATASIPIAISLMLKGFSPGAAFVFLATGPATNAASLSIITKTLGKKTAVLFVLIISFSSIAFGYLLNWIFALLNIDFIANLRLEHQHHHHGAERSLFEWSIIGIFLILLLMSVFRKYGKPNFDKKRIKKMEDQRTKILIDGMTCNHCVMNVKKAISAVEGVTNSEVVLTDNAAYLEGNFDLAAVKSAIEDKGYKVL